MGVFEMKVEKFTPGEWRVEEHDLSISDFTMFQFQILTDEYRICASRTDDPENIQTMKANAALIAAAPEMYALLKMIADPTTFMGSLTNNDLRIAIESILKKARGGK